MMYQIDASSTATSQPRLQGCQGFAWVPPNNLLQAFLDKKDKLTVRSTPLYTFN
jgi:hypothetical protein